MARINAKIKKVQQKEMLGQQKLILSKIKHSRKGEQLTLPAEKVFLFIDK
jgi:hypothetical protein